jgi:hypothetical protein
MSPRVRHLIPQLGVVVLTVVVSLILAQRGVPPMRRLITSGALGIILLAVMTGWRVGRSPRSQR